MNRSRIAMWVGLVAGVGGLAIWWKGCGASRDGEGENAAGRAGASGGSTAVQRGRDRDVRRLPRASIEGTVRDPAGAPISGARVCAFASSSELSQEETRDPICALSGAGGGYRLADLLPARYGVHASAAGRVPGRFRPARSAAGRGDRDTPVHLGAGEARRGVDIVLKSGGVEVAGVVKDIGGGPVAGAWVFATAGDRWSERGGTSAAQSDASGEFRLWSAPGTVHLSAQADGYSEGSKSAVAPGLRVEILLTPESILAGRVVELGSGAPVAGALVSADDDWRGGWGGGGSAVTDGGGRFRITRLLPGRYKPTASAAGRYGQARESALVGLGQSVDDIVIEVHPAAVVTGVVSIAGGAPCPSGWVGLRYATSDEETGGRIEEAGAVTIKAVLPGTYRVEVSCEGFVEAKEYPDLAVTAGADPPRQTWTVARGARIRGAVKTSTGEPVAGAEVSARSAGGDPRAQRIWGWDVCEEDGTFALEGLVGGRYKVSAESERFPEPKDPLAVEVAEGGEASVEIVLEPTGTIAGEVVDERGRPVAGVQVVASGSQRWDWKSTLTRDDGTFSLEGVRPGRQRVTAMRERGWGDALRAPGSSDDDDQGQKVEVAAGGAARVHLVVESQDGVIQGRVVDASGAAVTDAFIDAERESDSAAARPGGAARSMRWAWARSPVLTDTDGRFRIEKLSPGKYTVRAFRRGGGESTAEGIAVGGRVTLTIRPTGSITGTVATAAGGPPERFTITITDDKRGFARSESFFRTGGAFALRELPAGTFELAASAGDGAGTTTVALADGQTQGNQTIRLEGRATVTGRVVALDSGKPLAGFRMMVSPVQGGGGFSFRNSGGEQKHISGPDGRFEVENAPAGRVLVGGFPVDWDDAGYGFVRMVATVASGRATDVGDVRVAPMRQKRGEKSGDLGFVLKETPPDVEPEDVVLEVALVRPAAARAGLAVGDVITSVDGHDVTGANHYLYGSLVRVAPGASVTLGLQRGARVELTAGQPR
jgi:protocatechuate 3,4-dioxygenase beta subunit